MKASLLICIAVLIFLNEAQGFHTKKTSRYSNKPRKLGKDGGTAGFVRKMVEDQNPRQYTPNEQSSGDSIGKMHTKSTSGSNNSKKKEEEDKKVELESSRETLLKKKEEKLSKNEETNNPQHHHHQDLLDMVGMDYSPASRRPPIHN